MKISIAMTDAVRNTRPWVMFVAVLGFLISFAMMAVAGLMVLGALKLEDSRSTAILFVLAGVIVLNGLLYFYPATKLWAFGNACSHFLATRSAAALEHGLAQHRRYWQFLGVLTIIAVVLNVIAGVITFSVGAFQALGELMPKS